jgi:hypothetical protein
MRREQKQKPPPDREILLFRLSARRFVGAERSQVEKNKTRALGRIRKQVFMTLYGAVIVFCHAGNV